MRKHAAVAVLGAALLAACSADSATLDVRVVTGLVPGAEFRIVTTELLSGENLETASHVDASTEAVARLGMPYATGQNVASFQVPFGDHVVRVRLARPNGSFLVERIVRTQIAGNAVVSVHITRDCVGVVCPGSGDNAALSTCLAGRCVDPRCAVDAAQFCPTLVFCSEAGSCRATSDCASPLCEEGVCIQQSTADVCTDEEWCNPDFGAGCQKLEPVDASSSSVCGTICTMPSSPCQFGYWKCLDADAPVCTPLQNRPSDFVCAPGRVCDVSGNCVTPVVLDPAVVVASHPLATSESGASDTFTVSLTQPPTSTVFLLLSSSDPSEATVTPAALAFTASNYSVPQTVTVNGVDDSVFDGAQAFSILTATVSSADERYSGLDPDDVVGSNADNETAGILVSPTTGLVTTESGESTTFTVVLQSEPTSSVTLGLASDDLTEGAATPSSLVFTPLDWSVAQTVTVTGVDDAVTDGDRTYRIVIEDSESADGNYNGLSVPSVSVVNSDDETRAIVFSRTSGVVTTEAGGVGSFSVSLNTIPTASVTITFSSSDPTEGTVSPASVVFTAGNFATPRTITVTGVDDSVADGNVAYQITAHVSATADADYALLSDRTVSCSNTDNEVPGVTVSPSTRIFTSELGATAMFSVVLNTQPTADVAIALASSNPGEGNVSAPSVTFTTADWNVPQSVTVNGVNDGVLDGNIPYTIVTSASSVDTSYGGISVADVAVTNNTALIQEAYVKASNPEPGDAFGNIDISGDGNTLAVGAMGEASNARGIGGDQTNNSSPFSGAVYVFARSGSTWVQQAYIKASNADFDDEFGLGVALSNDGSSLVVGAKYESSNAVGVNGDQSNNSAMRSGAAYVFRRVGSSWSQEAYIKASNTRVGMLFSENAVALSGDGDAIAIGCTRDASNAVGINGVDTDTSLGGAGAVFLFARTAGIWAQQAYIKASNTGAGDMFGNAVSLSDDGNTLVVGAVQEASGASGVGANQLDDSAFAAGAAYVFSRSGTSWMQTAYLKASNAEASDGFGGDVAVSGDGSTIAVGAIGESSNARGVNGDQLNNASAVSGAVYVFINTAGLWSQQAYLKASNSDPGDRLFPVTLSQNGNRLATSASNEQSPATGVNGNANLNLSDSVGAVYIFERSGTTWTQPIYLKTAAGDRYDYFGRPQLSSDGTVLAASAGGEAGCDPGINGSETSEACGSSGAGYIFSLE